MRPSEQSERLHEAVEEETTVHIVTTDFQIPQATIESVSDVESSGEEVKRFVGESGAGEPIELDVYSGPEGGVATIVAFSGEAPVTMNGETVPSRPELGTVESVE